MVIALKSRPEISRELTRYTVLSIAVEGGAETAERGTFRILSEEAFE